jgi:hypothetical protein
MKSNDRFPAWPEQAGFMRAQMCCSFLEPLLERDVYLKVRTAVARWDISSEVESPETIRARAAVNARWGKKAG